jgi:hypothetical protein
MAGDGSSDAADGGSPSCIASGWRDSIAARSPQRRHVNNAVPTGTTNTRIYKERVITRIETPSRWAMRSWPPATRSTM